ncbi:unnamed protein product [Notodromas monacha]|uniref:Ankyrin repeat protein n=1 Tax=Notodromas monacha TaxID=399045 RepID=A0A7R9BDG4_9CRUS|nr:unnamed protein product [Notodromas monacha]CAG0912226.1 unnamed protein product [Notodromas monacha]
MVSECETIDLHMAIQNRDVEKVKQLLATGEDPNQPDYRRNAEIPLLEAAETGDVDLVIAMIEGGCDTNVRNWQGETALHFVTRQRHPNVEILKVLLYAEADQSLTDNVSGWSPLHHTLKHFSASKTKEELSNLKQCVDLIACAKNVNKKTKRSQTALHLVALSGIDDTELIESLLRVGAQPNVFDDEGASPLMLATERNCPRLVRLLLQNGANPEATNRYKETALHVAARRNLVTVAEELLKADQGKMINAEDLDGCTALHLAAGRGYREMLTLLLRAPHVDVNAVNDNGYTALHIAVESGFTNVVTLLVNVKECDVRRLTKRRLSAMDLANSSTRQYSSPTVSEVLNNALETSSGTVSLADSIEEVSDPVGFRLNFRDKLSTYHKLLRNFARIAAPSIFNELRGSFCGTHHHCSTSDSVQLLCVPHTVTFDAGHFVKK